MTSYQLILTYVNVSTTDAAATETTTVDYTKYYLNDNPDIVTASGAVAHTQDFMMLTAIIIY